jgi:hypothetical protein
VTDSGAPRQHLDPRQQLREREGLGQVVVPAGTQALDAVVHLGERAQDQDRRRHALRSQGLHNGQAVHIGEHPVGDYHVVPGGERERQAVCAIRGMIHAVAALAKPVRDVFRRAQVVLDQQQLHRCGS